MASTVNEEIPRKGKKRATEEFVTNRLHPVQVEYSYPIGVRVDMDRALPLDLMEEDPDEVLDMLSSPPDYEDRISPLSCTFNSDTLSGINPSDLQMKFLRKLTTNLGKIAQEIELASKMRFGEKGAISFMGLGLDPETVSRIIETDYDTADNVYSRLSELMEKGLITPIATTPFHTLLPLYTQEFEIRLLIRIGMEFYWPLLKKYNRSVARLHGEKYFIMPFWLPEGGYSAKVLQILHQEFVKRCEAESITPYHLIVLLDSEQSKEREQDVLMKRWNTLRPAPTTRDIVTIMFKERNFTDWVISGHPSTKKQLDRTIAKVDAVLRDQAIDHLWCHFEPISTLLSTFKTCHNFEQKIVKLTELKYQPCGPDVFVRRKLLKMYGMEEGEPRRTTLRDCTTWCAWPDTPGSLVRFTGCDEVQEGFTTKKVLGGNRPYIQTMPDGTKRERAGNPCWKPALLCALQRVNRAIVGEPKTFMGGMLGMMREILPIRRVPVAMRNIEDFLVAMARIAWKEHFIHHGASEADIQLREMCFTHLLKDAPSDEEEPELSDEECCMMGAAAHAIYLAHMGLNSTAFAFENMDNRAVYENVTMMTLAVTHAITAFKWREEEDKANELFNIFKEELLEFESAYTRHKIKELGVDEKTWKTTIASEVPQESDLNVVTRAARRVGAKHLRLLGFRNHFDRKDEGISNATGHIWSHEVEHLNYKWENEAFCGLREE
ncbi:glycoside hydrolase [soil metagenome]